MNRSAHAGVVAALEDEDLHGVVVIDRGPLDLQDQDLADVVLGRHAALVGHVLLQLQVHEELRVRLHVHEVLSDDVVRLPAETLVRDGLDLQREVEVAEVLEGDGRHADLVLLGRDLDDGRVLVRLVEVLDADDLRHLALRVDGQTHRLQTLQLDLEEALDDVVLPHRRDLDGHLHLRALFLPDLETHLLEVLEPFVTAHREDVFVEVVELGVVAAGNHAQHEGVGAVVLDDLVLEADGHVELLNRPREQRRLAEHDVGAVDLHEVLRLRQLSRVLLLRLRLLH